MNKKYVASTRNSSIDHNFLHLTISENTSKSNTCPRYVVYLSTDLPIDLANMIKDSINSDLLNNNE